MRVNCGRVATQTVARLWKSTPTRFLRAMQYTPIALQQSRDGVPSFEACLKADYFNVLTGRNVKTEACRKILGDAPKLALSTSGIQAVHAHMWEILSKVCCRSGNGQSFPMFYGELYEKKWKRRLTSSILCS